MITKILFTAAVIAIVIFIMRMRNRAPVVAYSRQAVKPLQPQPNRFARLAASAVILVIVVASALFGYYELQDAYRVVEIKVINTQTGHSVTYQARRRDVDDRQFETLDGRFVSLAEVERMELGGKE